MHSPEEKHESGCIRRSRPETADKYREAVELYCSTALSTVEICRRCGVSVNGFSRYIGTYHRHLMLRRNGVNCTPQEASSINLGQRRGQRIGTHAKYKDAIAACHNKDHIELNVSEIAREFGLDGTNLGRQLRTHYPGVIEVRERVRQAMGLDDGLPRGSRPWCTEQYAQAVRLLSSERYMTVQEAALVCSVSYTGLEQHLIFYHSQLVNDRIEIRKQALRQTRKGMINGRGSTHAPAPETVKKYAEALRLYRTTPVSARQIAMQTGVTVKGFYEYLHTWHQNLVCERKGIPYEEGKRVDWSQVRRYNPATAAKYSEAIGRLKEGGHTVSDVAAKFGLNPECFRQYLKEHEPELHANIGMMKTDKGKAMSQLSMEKYASALQLYATTSRSLSSLAREFGFNACSFRQFILRQYPELYDRHQILVHKDGEKH